MLALAGDSRDWHGHRTCQEYLGVGRRSCISCHTGFSKKKPSSYILSHHTYPSLINDDQCMPASEPKWLCFFLKGLSRQSGVTTLTWGDKGPIIFFAVNETACLFFWRTQYRTRLCHGQTCFPIGEWHQSIFIGVSIICRLIYNIHYKDSHHGKDYHEALILCKLTMAHIRCLPYPPTAWSVMAGSAGAFSTCKTWTEPVLADFWCWTF
jgi:hypothetical protein